jgi:electron transport complex protein RnfD
MVDEGHLKLLHIATSPHIRHGESVPTVMRSVIIALLPAVAASIFFFGFHALLLIGTSVCFCVLTEMSIAQFLLKSKNTTADLSAVVTGLLLALTLPPGLPLWIAAIGAIFATGVAKCAFGGLGNNFINPALAGRAFMMAAYPVAMCTFTAPRGGTINGLTTSIDGLTSATPLALFKQMSVLGKLNPLDLETALRNLFVGNVGGCIGETSAIALLLGACLLWYKHIIGLKIPLTFIGTVFLLYWIFNGTGELFTSEGLIVSVYQTLSGGLLLGALFMANDTVTSPVTARGKILFGFGCGLLTFLIRRFGNYPEGVCYAVLIMNCLVPLLDRSARPRRNAMGAQHV